MNKTVLFLYVVFIFRFCNKETTVKKVAIIMGSDSDLPIAEKAASKLDELQIPHEVHVYSAHRTPDEALTFSRNAEDNGIGVIISIAGKAAHLGGVLASCTTVPVIGVPCQSADLGGMDALLSTVQMPPGIPVASMAIGGGMNAAIYAAQILALSDEGLSQRLKADRKAMKEKVLMKNSQIEERFGNGR